MTISRTKSRTKLNPYCEPEPTACPACGGLKCLCRPRFFAGQLLSEQDLNRLDRYIVEKNRLHNRYLHGWGVVCGLEVGCDPCDDSHVSVSQGYAISPCGDDIVVCEQDSVDICKLINGCRRTDQPDCRPYGKNPNRDCKDIEEQWVLAISYQENPSRGITALKGGACEDCGCSQCQCQSQSQGQNRGESGCSGGCGNPGCDCQQTQNKPRITPAQCEPTLTCEGYRYEVFPLPRETIDWPSNKDEDEDKGAMYDRLLCCIEPLLTLVKSAAAAVSQAESQQGKYQACCMAKRDLADYIAGLSISHCDILCQLDAISCPDPNLDEGLFEQRMDELGDKVMVVVWQVMVECICKALMPPCPDPVYDQRVPLAVVTVTGGQCKVVKVCNWTVLRKFVMTFPNLKYWMSWLPYGRMLRKVIEYLCCNLPVLKTDFDQESINLDDVSEGGGQGLEEIIVTGVGESNAQPKVKQKDSQFNQEFMQVALKAYLRDQESLTVKSVMQGLAGIDDKSGIDELERRNSVHFLLLNMIAKPMFDSSVPGFSQLGDSLSQGGILEMVTPLMNTMAKKDDENIKGELSELKQQLKQQQQAISFLQFQLDNK